VVVLRCYFSVTGNREKASAEERKRDDANERERYPRTVEDILVRIRHG
jgi:hypothetical protein